MLLASCRYSLYETSKSSHTFNIASLRNFNCCHLLVPRECIMKSYVKEPQFIFCFSTARSLAKSRLPPQKRVTQKYMVQNNILWKKAILGLHPFVIAWEYKSSRQLWIWRTGFTCAVCYPDEIAHSPAYVQSEEYSYWQFKHLYQRKNQALFKGKHTWCNEWEVNDKISIS